MRTLKLIGACLAVLGMSVCCISCSEDDEVAPPPEEPTIIQSYLELNKESFRLDGKAQTIAVTVESNIEGLSMSFYKGEPWISSVDTRVADYSKIFQFNIDENRDDSTRVELIIFRAGNLTEATTIIQDPLVE